jgi:excisionase family DNA binding protein
MATGRVDTIVPTDADITIVEAADLLHVSCPFVVGMIDQGELPVRMVGEDPRMRREDVLAYKRESKARARTALKEMVAISQGLGLE